MADGFWARIALSGALLAGAASVAGAQAQEFDAARIAAARAEGGFFLYGSISEGQLKTLVTAFDKKFGVKGDFIRLASGPLSQRYAANNEGGANDADILLDSTPQVYELHPEWFAKIDPKEITNAARWPAKWLTATAATIQTSGSVVQFNTELVAPADVPKTWADIINPKFKGKIVLTDPRISDTYFGWVDMLSKRYGDDFIRKLAAQDLKLTQSGASGAQLVAAGAFALNFPAYASFSIPLIEKKAPIDSRIMSDPTLVSTSALAVAAKAPHPKTARLFMDWVLSEDVTRTICATFPISTPGDPEGKLGCIPLKDPQPLEWQTPEARRRQLVDMLGLTGK